MSFETRFVSNVSLKQTSYQCRRVSLTSVNSKDNCVKFYVTDFLFDIYVINIRLYTSSTRLISMLVSEFVSQCTEIDNNHKITENNKIAKGSTVLS